MATLSNRERAALEQERSDLIRKLANITRDNGPRAGRATTIERDEIALRVKEIGAQLSIADAGE